MEYKKYLIFENLENCQNYLFNLNSNLHNLGVIDIKDSWDIPRKVGINTNTFSKRYWIYSPKEEYITLGDRSLVSEMIDSPIPSDLTENIFKIYNFVNGDADNRIDNYFRDPISLEYKKDVNIRFPTEEIFDVYGNLITINYYESVNIDINPLGIKTTTYINKILTVSVNYVYGDDGYLNYRDITREWYLLDDTIGCSITKRKFYTNNQAKKAGERRRKNIQNILETKVGTALFLKKGSPLVGGDGTFNTVAEADTYGKPLLNALSIYFNKYITNNEHDLLLNEISNIDETTYDWVLEIDPFTNKTIKQLSYDIIQDSILL